MKTGKLSAKIAVITGGSSGIGLATAKRFVEEGAYVFITGRRQAELDKAVAEIGRNVTGVQGDVSNLDDLDRLYKEVETKKGKLDVLFANAGIAEPVPTPDVTPEHYDRTFDINTRGVFFAVHKALPLMKDGGSIIVNGSGAWQKGIPMYAAYAATKAALRSFVRTWTAEFAGKGIRANVISPGPVETPILEGQFGENTDAVKERFKAMVPMGRIGKPEEIASAAVFLASEESSYITGIDLPVDGGLVAV
ncbi:MAG: Glucose 1-dehydrogenase 4 [Candidatus Udaeobacter sp.]|nr:MAG: Glucose 1-dehydrogenase 4 [Candidatus Udaeobacter sp.]